MVAHSQGYTTVTWDNGTITGNTAHCHAQNNTFQQNAAYVWTMWCYDLNTGYTIRSASPPVTATGTGACPDGSTTACSSPMGEQLPSSALPRLN